MAAKESGGWADALISFFDWKIWESIGTVLENASKEHPTFVLVLSVATFLFVFGVCAWMLHYHLRRRDEYKSRELYINLKNKADLDRIKALRRLAKPRNREELRQIEGRPPRDRKLQKD